MGFIGSAVVRRAIKSGHTVVNVDSLTYAACLDNVACVTDNPSHVFEKADICDGVKMSELLQRHKPDAIMHLAAESHVDRSIDGPSAFIETNIVGTYKLLEAARHWWISQGRPEGFRFHHISTDEVFGSLGTTGFFLENSPYQPNSPYSASKAGSDHLVRAWHETYGLPIIVTNCSNNYGPFQFPEKLIPVVILKALAGENIPVYGNGDNVRDWLHVEDHAEALLLALEKGTIGRSYNIGGDNEMTNLELIKKVCSILDRLKPGPAPYSELITFVQDRPGHDKRYAINAARVKKELNWRPSHTPETGLEQTVRWYLDNSVWLNNLKSRTGVGKRLGISD